MDRLLDRAIDLARAVRTVDRARLAREVVELGFYVRRQLLLQIPSISALAGIAIGSWVASTFTTSPIRGFLARRGLVEGGTHVVGSTTYRILSVLLPLAAMAVTAYVVQKGLKIRRERQLARDVSSVAQLAPEIRAQVTDRMAILEAARSAGLLSESEYETKRSVLYQSYARRSRSRLEEFILNKLA